MFYKIYFIQHYFFRYIHDIFHFCLSFGKPLLPVLIADNIIHWIVSFLTDRYQFVKVEKGGRLQR